MPLMLALGEPQRPIQQVAHMRQNLYRSPSPFRCLKFSESAGCAAKSFAATIGERGDGMAQELALGIVHDFGFEVHSQSDYANVALVTTGSCSTVKFTERAMKQS